MLICLDSRHLQSGLGPPYEIARDLADKRQQLEKYIPVNPKPAGQEQYIRFRLGDLAKSLGIKWLLVSNIQADDHEILVSIDYFLGNPVHYHFSPTFDLIYAYAGADFERKYKQWILEGKATLSLSDFIKSCTGEVSYWDGHHWSSKPQR